MKTKKCLYCDKTFIPTQGCADHKFCTDKHRVYYFRAEERIEKGREICKKHLKGLNWGIRRSTVLDDVKMLPFIVTISGVGDIHARTLKELREELTYNKRQIRLDINFTIKKKKPRAKRKRRPSIEPDFKDQLSIF